MRMGLIRESLLRFNEHTEMNERMSIGRKFFADLAKEVGLNTYHLDVLGERQHWEIVVGGDMLERLVGIQRQFERLAVMGDDEYRGFYIEVPRPAPEEWGDAEELIASGEYDSREAFLADWLAFNPMETRWFHVASTRYGDSRSLRVTDRKRTMFIITNCPACADGAPDDAWCRDILTRLFDYLQRLIDVVVADPDRFNDYVAHNLPYQQRTGRIAQKEFNRIVPNSKIEVEDKETAIKALEDSVHGRSVPPLETMTIRLYCTYFRIANEAYEAYYRKRGASERVYEDPQDVPEELRDVAYYKRMKFVYVETLYDIDSPADFIRFATDHYGELGLSRLNIFALNKHQQGWMIVVSNSYSANAGLAIEVATALYKAGAPLLIFDAERLLRILREEDWVRLIPSSFHNYMGYQEEGTVYELPWEYECSDDGDSPLTREQYHAIVSLTEWQPEERVKPIIWQGCGN